MWSGLSGCSKHISIYQDDITDIIYATIVLHNMMVDDEDEGVTNVALKPQLDQDTMLPMCPTVRASLTATLGFFGDLLTYATKSPMFNSHTIWLKKFEHTCTDDGLL